MTIRLDDYVPSVAPVNAARLYGFPFPYAEDTDIVVVEIADNGARLPVRPQDYTLQTDTNPRQPTKEGGTVTFSRPHAANVEEVAIERNTLITQLADFSQEDDFNTRMLEFVLDKATMILQELNERKCESVPGQDITQLLIFGSHFAIPGPRLQSAVDKLYTIALAIDQSAQDCRGRPDLT